MKTTTQEATGGRTGPSGDERLRLAEEIVKRAYELWLAGVAGTGTTSAIGFKPNEKYWNSTR